jgi:hypothetical protein
MIDTRERTVEIDTIEYERVHGRAPRRAEYGLWLLRIDNATVELTGEWLRVRRALLASSEGGTYHLLP